MACLRKQHEKGFERVRDDVNPPAVFFNRQIRHNRQLSLKKIEARDSK